jgi:hypothetical protein
MEPKMPTPEEMAKIQKTRTESDAELLKDSAEYVVDEKGGARLDVTKEQMDSIRAEMNTELNYENKSLDDRIRNAKSMAELTQIILSVQGMEDTQKTYSSYELAKQLHDVVWLSQTQIQSVTRTHGLRKKVIELTKGTSPFLSRRSEVGEEISGKIKNAQNISDLEHIAIQYNGIVTEASKGYTAWEIIEAIKYAKEHPEEDDDSRYKYVSSGYGLRDKVKELMDK